MSTLAIWCRLVRSRDVSLHNFDGLAMSGLAFSVAPFKQSATDARARLSYLQELLSLEENNSDSVREQQETLPITCVRFDGGTIMLCHQSIRIFDQRLDRFSQRISRSQSGCFSNVINKDWPTVTDVRMNRRTGVV